MKERCHNVWRCCYTLKVINPYSWDTKGLKIIYLEIKTTLTLSTLTAGTLRG